MRLEDAPVIGTMGPRPDGLDAPYWEGLAEGRLVLQRCEACGEWIWGPQWVCPACRAIGPGWAEVEPRGQLFSWTRTWQPFTPELADRVPFVTVLVELPGAGGRRVLGILVDTDDQRDPELGEEMVGVVQPANDANGSVPVLRWTRP